MLMLNLKPPESISTRAEGSGLRGCRISASQTSGASGRQAQPRKTETLRLQSLKASEAGESKKPGSREVARRRPVACDVFSKRLQGGPEDFLFFGGPEELLHRRV